MRKNLLIVGIILLVVGGVVFLFGYYTLQNYTLQKIEQAEQGFGWVDLDWGDYYKVASKYAALGAVLDLCGIVAIVGVIFTVLGTVLKPLPPKEK